MDGDEITNKVTHGRPTSFRISLTNQSPEESEATAVMSAYGLTPSSLWSCWTSNPVEDVRSYLSIFSGDTTICRTSRRGEAGDKVAVRLVLGISTDLCNILVVVRSSIGR